MDPDVDMMEERLYELYVAWCTNNGVQPKLDEYTIWLDEHYN